MTTLPPPADQAERLIELGVPALLGQNPDAVREAATALGSPAPGLLVTEAARTHLDELVPLICREGQRGFIVEDFVDTADFVPVSGLDPSPITLPDGWYWLEDPRRGDEFENASPAEAWEQIVAANRVPLTAAEGVFWLLQQPDTLERNHCFMTVGSRKPRPRGGYDSRTPALWISNGTGRDGSDRKNAPKLGWCWWNNRHTWLGIAHAAARHPAQP
ncbi:DUF5701 family protein [Scrofimicrobium sp. R131]|uniref:DUF5701 family protein n=1 Tax=Scrofimicrobium appendicitidis TaxID=3079930 RepID=A0AAU7V806_9ACTO